MNKLNLTGTLLAAALALGLASPALATEAEKTQKGGACAADTAKFCKDVKPGEGRVKACLSEHKKELSKACTERLEKRAERKDKLQARGRGGRGGKACSAAFEKGFSSGFVRAMKMGGAKPGRGFMKEARAARGGKLCKADAEKLCKEVKPGEGRVKACLRQNLDKLSEGCKARQEKAIKKEKAAEKEVKA